MYLQEKKKKERGKKNFDNDKRNMKKKRFISAITKQLSF